MSRAYPIEDGQYNYVNLKRIKLWKAEVKNRKVRIGIDTHFYCITSFPGWWKKIK